MTLLPRRFGHLLPKQEGLLVLDKGEIVVDGRGIGGVHDQEQEEGEGGEDADDGCRWSGFLMADNGEVE